MAECLQSDMWNRSNVKEWTRRLVTSCRTLRYNSHCLFMCFSSNHSQGINDSVCVCVCVNEREIDNAVKRESKKEND